MQGVLFPNDLALRFSLHRIDTMQIQKEQRSDMSRHQQLCLATHVLCIRDASAPASQTNVTSDKHFYLRADTAIPLVRI
jgi:hypothetical protein